MHRKVEVRVPYRYHERNHAEPAKVPGSLSGGVASDGPRRGEAYSSWSAALHDPRPGEGPQSSGFAEADPRHRVRRSGALLESLQASGARACEHRASVRVDGA